MAQADTHTTPASARTHPLNLLQLVEAYFAAYQAAETAEEESRDHVRALRRWEMFHDRIAGYQPSDLAELRDKARVMAHYQWPGPDGVHCSPKPLAVLWRDLARLAA